MNKAYQQHRSPIGRTAEYPFGIQHDPFEYYQPQYLSPTRMSSYAHQFRLAMGTDSMTFLNVGSSNGLLNYLLSAQNKAVIDLDLVVDTKPFVCGALPTIPIKDKAIDVAMCFQVLEHLPFPMFVTCLRELKRIANDFIILSLPDRTISKHEKIKYKIYNALNRPKEWSAYRTIPIDGEHFWEIGHVDITIDIILQSIELENIKVITHYRNKLHNYHHFFMLKI